PEARAERTRLLRVAGRLAVPEDPPGPPALRLDADDGIARQASPGLEVATDRGIVADDRHELTAGGRPKRRDDVEQEPAGEGPSPGFDLDPGLQHHVFGRSEPRLSARTRVVNPRDARTVAIDQEAPVERSSTNQVAALPAVEPAVVLAVLRIVLGALFVWVFF